MIIAIVPTLIIMNFDESTSGLGTPTGLRMLRLGRNKKNLRVSRPVLVEPAVVQDQASVVDSDQSPGVMEMSQGSTDTITASEVLPPIGRSTGD
ncbi:hypothetical protein FRB94_005329 [Tulasnella sp. JGI-2019a]|nr:hypothetical protein FRB93_002785 [Tulasnella sp. JGI-2019a]KAG9000583.1 hypothetical protein FRB94_005329 [Tulasnella sp. JGI-2019a]KAG9030013.1 hypothetical protein FRB95_004659 [Tulasnella sp. JGI-2019a]